MEKLRIILALLTLSVVIPGCGVDPCRNESPMSIDGCVQDDAGNAIPGVKIYGYADPPEGIRPEPACSTWTDTAGVYSIPFICNVKEFVVIPSREGCVFAPGSRLWRTDAPHESYDFTVYCGGGYLVDGHVWGREGPGQPFPGVELFIESSDGSRRDCTVTDENGHYVFYDLYPLFDYEIAPYVYCYEYEPASRAIEHPAEDYHDQDFTLVTPALIYIRGCVRDPYGNPLEGVTLEFSIRVPLSQDCGTPDPSVLTTQLSVETDANGRYSIHIMSCVYVEVRPSEPGCFAVPHIKSYGLRSDIDGQDYTLFCGEGHTISGYIKNEYEEPMPDRPVDISGRDFGWYEVRSDASGYYEITNLPWGLDYEVKPGHCPGYCTCEPARREYQDLDRDYSDQDFIMSRIQ